MADILVIENDKLLQKALRRMLRGHAVVMVATGLDAIALLEDVEFDMVISDYDLDGPLTGEDVLKWVRLNKPDLVSKYTFCSGNEDKMERLQREASVQYLLKPATAEQVQALIKTVLGGEL